MAQNSIKITKQKEVCRELLNDLRAGRYGSRRRMPSEHALMGRFNVSRFTIRGAFKELEEQGLISRRAGSGTYANVIPETPALTDDVSPDPDRVIRQVAFLLTDLSEKSDYTLRELAAMERYFSGQGIALAWSSISTADLIEGRFPAALVRGLCDGLILDGHVSGMHVAIARRFRLPMLVSGVHDVPPEVPQVRYVIRPRIRQAVVELRQANPQAPVALLVEPFPVFYNQEIIFGYQDGLRDVGQSCSLIYPCSGAHGAEAVAALAQAYGDGFAIITGNGILPSTLEAYSALGLNLLERPVFALCLRKNRTAPVKIPGLIRVYINPERLALLTGQHMVRMLREGLRTSIVESLEEEQ